MNEHLTDAEHIEQTRNLSRYSIEQRHVAWVLLAATVLWGLYALMTMPQHKDPITPVRVAAAIIPWPGASAEKIEQLAVKPVETSIALNTKVLKIEAVVRTGVAILTFELDRRAKEVGKEFDDIKLRLDGLEGLPPGAGPVYFIKDFGDTTALMLTIASPKAADGVSDKYSARELDQYSEQIEKALRSDTIVARIERTGRQQEVIWLEFAQEKLAAYNIPVDNVIASLSARNIPTAGPSLESNGRRATLVPSGAFQNTEEIGDVRVLDATGKRSVYLRDLVTVQRGYEDPARFLNFYSWKDDQGRWQRSGAVTLAVNMREGEQIGEFGSRVDSILTRLKTQLPADLMLVRTSDAPQQVRDNVALFTRSLLEAVALVVLISWIGFREWRSAMLMALSIPLTLLMTFGMMELLGIDIQQVSIASLILALGLLVDDPVVAGDAIKRELAEGKPRGIAAWLGPTKLARAIFYATVTNIVAYLPFLLLKGDTGEFIYSLPVVMTCSLVASRIVSMSFIPLLGYYLLRPSQEASVEERTKRGFAAWYFRLGSWAIEHRWITIGTAVILLVGTFMLTSNVKQMYSPRDLSNYFYADVWLPEDAALKATNEKASKVEKVIAEAYTDFARERGQTNDPKKGLERLTTFVGGGGPRFWYSVQPELEQPGYAQVVVELRDKYETEEFIRFVQPRVDAQITGAIVDVRRLDTAGFSGLPVALRLIGNDANALRARAEELKAIVRSSPLAARVRDNWGVESLAVTLNERSRSA